MNFDRCRFNTNIMCDTHKCDKCGWNPEVEKERIADIRARFAMARELLKGNTTGKSWVWRYRQVEGVE